MTVSQDAPASPDPVAADAYLAAAPPFAGPLESALRRPLLVLVPFVVLLVAAVAYGLGRAPVHTAEARLTVGRTDVPAYTLQGVIQGNATLAASFARAIGASPVTVAAAKAAGVSPGAASGRLSASPVPGSTLIRVNADGPDAASAERLANAGARALLAYVTGLQATQQSTNLLARYRAERAEVDRDRRSFQDLQLAAAPRTGRPAAAQATLEGLLDSARITLELARLETANLRNQIVTTGGPSTAAQPVQLLTEATRASSDRSDVLEQIGLIGGAAGLVLGLALATLSVNRRTLRRRPA